MSDSNRFITTWLCLFYELENALQRQLEELLKEHHAHHSTSIPLTTSQFHIACYILFQEPLTISELASQFGISKASMSSAIDRLEKHRMATRARLDKDKRVVYVLLTDYGKTVIEQMHASWVSKIEERVAKPLTKQEQDLFLELMSKIGKWS